MGKFCQSKRKFVFVNVDVSGCHHHDQIKNWRTVGNAADVGDVVVAEPQFLHKSVSSKMYNFVKLIKAQGLEMVSISVKKWWLCAIV